MDTIPGKFRLEVDTFRAIGTAKRLWEAESVGYEGPEHQFGKYFVENGSFEDEKEEREKTEIIAEGTDGEDEDEYEREQRQREEEEEENMEAQRKVAK